MPRKNFRSKEERGLERHLSSKQHGKFKRKKDAEFKNKKNSINSISFFE